MTDDDLAVLLFVASFHAQRGRLPRFREIAEARGTSRSAAKAAVRRLRAVGQLPQYDRWFAHDAPIRLVAS